MILTIIPDVYQLIDFSFRMTKKGHEIVEHIKNK